VNKRINHTRRRSRRKQPDAAPLPLAPGWYVQWAGRSDWQVETEKSARMIAAILAAPGDRVIHVEGTK
jgi:hypothetical protein